jgi:hypothetical protein
MGSLTNVPREDIARTDKFHPYGRLYLVRCAEHEPAPGPVVPARQPRLVGAYR